MFNLMRGFIWITKYKYSFRYIFKKLQKLNRYIIQLLVKIKTISNFILIFRIS
jgi:hypothetical protein